MNALQTRLTTASDRAARLPVPKVEDHVSTPTDTFENSDRPSALQLAGFTGAVTTLLAAPAALGAAYCAAGVVAAAGGYTALDYLCSSLDPQLKGTGSGLLAAGLATAGCLLGTPAVATAAGLGLLLGGLATYNSYHEQ